MLRYLASLWLHPVRTANSRIVRSVYNFRYMVEGVVKSSPYGLFYAKLGIIYVKTGNFC